MGTKGAIVKKMIDLILACALWIIAVLANALCDSIKQSKARDHQDRLWHYSKYFVEWIARFLAGFFARPFLIEWFRWEHFDEWHYTMPVAIFGTVILLCIPLHWWERVSLINYWNDKYEAW
ncbi:MAG: hypothetical protein KKH44_02975 [Bacteroidetes bacterium]|nr:hypothetical protein [Bacteroidota bacterium]